MTEPVAPRGDLARELDEVARSAGDLRRALAAANFLPDDFPRGDLDAVAGTLELTPGMSADGALDALTYARPKLSQLRRASVKIADDAEELPDVGRGGAIDNAMARLIADVDTAREWYYEARKAAAEGSEVPEAAAAPGGTADFVALATRANRAADDSAAIADELADGATPGSVAADNLVRRVRDVAVLSRQEGIELAAPRPRLRLLDRLNRARARCVSFVEGALFAVEAGADFANITWEHFSNIATRQISVVLEEVRDGAAELRKRIAHYKKVWAATKGAAGGAPDIPAVRGDPRNLPDLAVFKDVDAPWCPEMVVIPAGSFLMGSLKKEEWRFDDEEPQHEVTIGYRFAIGRYAVTFDEYDRFCAATKRDKADDQGWGRGRRPVINVSWQDAQSYVAWLSEAAKQRYRLPSEAEWEYACRAGTTTPFSFGATISTDQANYDGNYTYGNGRKGEYRQRTVPVGSLPANPWGLYEMHGNVWEWVADVWHDSYQGAPADGSAWTDGQGLNSSSRRVLRGSCWNRYPRNLRSAKRVRSDPVNRNSSNGFRVARTLD